MTTNLVKTATAAGLMGLLATSMVACASTAEPTPTPTPKAEANVKKTSQALCSSNDECGGGEECINGECQAVCQPRSCDYWECGMQGDSCGGFQDCGECHDYDPWTYDPWFGHPWYWP